MRTTSIRHRLLLGMLALATSGALMAAPAYAAPPPVPPAAPPAADAAPPPSPEALAAAKELTDLLGVPNQARVLIAQVRVQLIGATMRSGAKDQADAIDIVDKLLMPSFAGHEQELSDALVRPYATSFALSDLKELIKFYRSPLGQRLINAMPAVTREGLRAGQEITQQIFRTAIDKNKDALKARGLKF
jgi:hypothetical protein